MTSQHPHIEAEVMAAVASFNRAFAANDPDAYFSHIDEDITVITPSNPYRIEGLASDRQEFEYGLRTGQSRVNYFQQLQTKVQVEGNVAIVTYYSRGSYGRDERSTTAYYKETDVLVRREDGWKLLHIHVSSTT